MSYVCVVAWSISIMHLDPHRSSMPKLTTLQAVKISVCVWHAPLSLAASGEKEIGIYVSVAIAVSHSVCVFAEDEGALLFYYFRTRLRGRSTGSTGDRNPPTLVIKDASLSDLDERLWLRIHWTDDVRNGSVRSTVAKNTRGNQHGPFWVVW